MREPLSFYEQIQTTKVWLEQHLIKGQPSPTLGFVLGSGLGLFGEEVLKSPHSGFVPYAEIPFFPVSRVKGHASRLLYGHFGKVPVLVMQGRIHYYEGYKPYQVAFPVWVMAALGIHRVVLTNASGGISPLLQPGDLMFIEDHINLTGHNPLWGPNDERLGQRFVDMSQVYCKDWLSQAQSIAQKHAIAVKKGVYMGVTGPCYETPAEIRAFSTLGAHAVGMSTVFEAISARHAGIEVLGISCITNKAAGLSETPLVHEEVTATSERVSKQLSQLLIGIVEEIG